MTRGVSDGGYSSGETPVPIPNTEVKTAYADGTAWVTVWKSRAPPSLTPLRFIKRKCSEIGALSKIKTIEVKIDIYRFPNLNTIHISQRLCSLG